MKGRMSITVLVLVLTALIACGCGEVERGATPLPRSPRPEDTEAKTGPAPTGVQTTAPAQVFSDETPSPPQAPLLGGVSTQYSGAEPTALRGSGQVIAADRQISEIERVVLTGPGDLIITQGEQESLTVETDDNLMSFVKIQVIGRTLHLGLASEAQEMGIQPTELVFYLMVKEIAALEHGGSGDIQLGSLQVDRIEIVMRGAGRIVVDALGCESLQLDLLGAGQVSVGSLLAERVTAQVGGSGVIALAGRATEQDIHGSGVGDYYAARLESQRVAVSVLGAGDVTVWAIDSLTGRITGTGDVEYYGNPAVSMDLLGSGELIGLDQPSTRVPTRLPPMADVAADAIQGSGVVVSETREASGFSRILLVGMGEVTISQGEREQLAIRVDDNLLPFVRAEVVDQVLVLGLADEAKSKDLRPTELAFDVTVTDVSGLELAGEGHFQVGTLETEKLEIVISATGDFVLDSLIVDELVVRLHGLGNVAVGRLAAQSVAVHLQGAGNVMMAGQVVQQSIFHGGMGDYCALQLASQTAVVDLNGIGIVSLWVTDTLDVRISGPSTVEYLGTPQVSSDIVVVGRLVSLGAP